ncbi:MAG: ABC transporter family substrate-binding protein [Jiangellaceae bacterium]
MASVARRRAAAFMALLAAVALTACAGDGGEGDPGDAAGQPGFEGCAENPNTCNEGERDDGGSITWLVVSKPTGWNAYSPEGGSVYTLQMLHGIYPHTGMFAPDRETYLFNMDLFSSEPELLTESPQSWQYVLRDEAEWDDGTPISADDFVVSWKLGTSPEEGHCEGCRSRATAPYDRVESIEGSADGKTVTVTMKEGEYDPEWFGFLNVDSIAGGLMPAHVAEQNGFDIDDPVQLGGYFEWLQENMPTFSGGPYRIVEGDFENQVIKEPNENWYGEIDPTLETYIIRVIDDQGAWVPALANDEIHGGSPIQLNEDVVSGIRELANVNIHILPGPSWEHVDFNMDVPAFQDVELRRAIFTAIDVEDIATKNFGEMFPDYTLRTNHVFNSSSPYHVDHVTETGQGSGDTAAALEILENAGYVLDGTTLTRDGEQVGPFRLRATADQARVTSMELIQSYLAEIGIEIIIETTDALGQMLGEQDYDIAQFGWSGSPLFVGQADQQWRTGSGSNFGNYTNPDVDRLAAEELTATTQDEAAEIANQAMEVLVQDAYVLPMYDSPVFIFASDGYVNVRDNTGESLRGVYNNHEWGRAIQ